MTQTAIGLDADMQFAGQKAESSPAQPAHQAAEVDSLDTARLSWSSENFSRLLQAGRKQAWNDQNA